MYICPTCQKSFESEEIIQKHFLNCWKEQHPYHQSNPAPHSEDIVNKQIDDGVLDFFENLRKQHG